MPTRNSSIISARLHNDDISKIKASGFTGSQILKMYADGKFDHEINIDKYLKACRKKGKDPQRTLDMITEQIWQM